MANKIQVKRSAVPSKVPTTSDLDLGEIAINTYDGIAYIKKDNGTQSIIPLGSGMVYPGAGIPNSTGSAWGTSYTTTGTGTVVALQTSPSLTSPTIDGANPYITFSDGTAVTVAAGRMWYNGTTGSWNLGMGGGNITQQVGEEIFVYGKASSAITEGQLIMKTGVVGASGVITFAPTSAGITDDNVIVGIATENIPLNGFGRVTAFGVVHGLNTSAFTDGATLWYDPTSSTGGMTATKPTAPNAKCEVGIVINAGTGGSGSIQVEIIHGTSLGGTDNNAQITSASNGQILTYDGSATYWKNTSLTAGTGISVSASSGGVLTVANSGVTSLTAGAGISVSGSTGAVTISATTLPLVYDQFTATAGQTSFTTSQNYSSGKIQVFRNGALMRNGTDVTVTSGTAVVFASGLTLNDVVDVTYPTVAGSNLMRYDQFTATASQTTFSTSATYNSGKIQVFAQGVLMRNGTDVTVTSGTSVVFATGLAVGTLVDVSYPPA